MALVEDASATGNKAIEVAVAEGGNFIEIMTRILVYGMELLEDDRRFREIMALTLFKTGDSSELAEYKEQKKLASVQTVESIAEFFQMGLANSELRADIDPVTVARAFLAYQNGLSMLWIGNPGVFSIKESASQLAEIFVKGIVP